MARPKAVWGIDIGQCALKALRLRDADGVLQVEAFDVIEHPMILSQPDADRGRLIREALQRFLARADMSGCRVVISVPGQSSFSRFVKLPPVESRRVPDIVRFEAEQQIPFPINEVIWRWQTFRDPDSPDVEVGLFAMKRSDVAEMLSHFNEVGIRVDVVQTAPLALYNFMTFDEQLAEDGATLLADVGADKTDLVVADKGRIWTRTIQIGGNNFTEALVRTFKLSFEKAEKLKRAAASSKYARQIFQSMRPVFADLVQEIQRSIGYYTSLHRETRFKRVLGLGNGFRLPGLQKFIEQNLNVPAARIDNYNRISPSSSASAPAVNEHVLSFAVAYGLALQGLELSGVNTNLLPEEILRKRRWNRKRPWFVAAAAALLAVLFCPGYRANLDSKTLANRAGLLRAGKVVADLERRIRNYKDVKDKGGDHEKQIRKLARLFGYRESWPLLLNLIARSIQAAASDQPRLAEYARYVALKDLHPRSYAKIAAGKGENLPGKDLDAAAGVLLDDAGQRDFQERFGKATPQALTALAKTLIASTRVDANSLAGLTGADLKNQVKRLALLRTIQQAEAFKATERKTRKVIALESLTSTYVPDLSADKAKASKSLTKGKAPVKRKAGFRLELVVRTPLPQDEANKMVTALYGYSIALAKWLNSLSVDSHTREWLAKAEATGPKVTAEATGPRMPDPLMPDEDMINDTRFKVTWWVAVESDGIVVSDVKAGNQYRVSKDLPLFPEVDPADAVAAAKRIQTLKPGTRVKIGGSVRIKGATPWYRADAMDEAGKSLGSGWVSGAALDQQELQASSAGP